MAFPNLEWDRNWLSVPFNCGTEVCDALVAGGMVKDVDFRMYVATKGQHTLGGRMRRMFLFTGDKGNEVLAKLIL
tara:strand:- start:1018 stop:1242 length:225 start_codon:yes stop_codon:yes gene_type:complete